MLDKIFRFVVALVLALAKIIRAVALAFTAIFAALALLALAIFLLSRAADISNAEKDELVEWARAERDKKLLSAGTIWILR